VFIHSREPGAYIIRVIGTGQYDFLLQVRDEERLLHWFSLFENSTSGGGGGGKQQAHQLYSSDSSSCLGSILPMNNLSMASLSDHQYHHQTHPHQHYPSDGLSSEEGTAVTASAGGEGSGGPQYSNQRSESDQTLFVNTSREHQQRHQSVRGNNDFLSPMQYYQQNQRIRQHDGSSDQRELDGMELTERGGARRDSRHDRHPSESIDLSQALSSLHPSTNPFVRRQQQQQQQ